MSTQTTSTAHARIFGLSLAALFAACLVLNAASRPIRVCHQSDGDFGATSTNSVVAVSGGVVHPPDSGSHEVPSGTTRAKECATKEWAEEPGY